MGSDKPIVEFRRSMSHREFLTRFHWMEEQLNEPDRHDHYAMQVAAEIRRSYVSNKAKRGVKLDHFKIKFGRKEAAKRESSGLTKEAASAIQKAKWFAITGFKPKHT